MKLNKTAAALALAGIAAAPLAQAEVTLTGNVGIGIIGSDASGDAGDLKMFGDDASINVAASSEMDNGLTAYGNYRTDLALVGDPAVGDNIHVGIKGDFGDIRMGEVPDATGYGQMAGDILSDDIEQENKGISYTGSFGGATVGLNWSPEGSSDQVGAGVKFNAGGFGIGIGAGDNAGNSEMSVGATFAVGSASVGLSYKDFDNNREVIGAKASYSAGKTSASITFATEAGDVDDGDSKIRLDAAYSLGGGMKVSTRVNMFTDDSDSAGDVTDYRLLFVKSF